MHKSIYLLFFLFVVLQVSGQDYLLIKKGKDYHYQNKIYKYEELSIVYEHHLPSLGLYLYERKIDRQVKDLALVGLGFVGGGLTLASIGLGPSYKINRRMHIVGAVGILTMVWGGVMEIVAVFLSVEGKAKAKKAHTIFNHEMYKRHGYREDQFLSFGMTNCGIGFTYQF